MAFNFPPPGGSSFPPQFPGNNSQTPPAFNPANLASLGQSSFGQPPQPLQLPGGFLPTQQPTAFAQGSPFGLTSQPPQQYGAPSPFSSQQPGFQPQFPQPGQGYNMLG